MRFSTGCRLVGCVLIADLLWSCTSWRLSNIEPRQLIENEAPSRVRVTRTNGAEAVLENPQVQGDTLYGSAPHSAKGDTLRNVALPLAEVKGVAVRRGDAGKTIAAVLGGGFLVAAVGLAVFVASYHPD